MADYKKLQNGSDIRGVAMEGIEGQEVNLTKEACRAIGRGFAVWLSKKLGKTDLTVAIGRDSRLTGEQLLLWASKAMAEQGVTVYDVGMASTPAMFMSTITEETSYDGSVMVTASHLPFNRNGYKFFTKDGGLEKADISEILAYAAGNDTTGATGGKVLEKPYMDVYTTCLRKLVMAELGEKKPLAGLHIVVDAGNGAGGFFASRVLGALGAKTAGSQFLDPDGRFPNHIPNPEDETAMESISKAVLENGADLGIIFDTDVDRAGAVLPDGRELNRNRLIAMISAILLRDHPGIAIVTDSITSTGLKEFIEKKGGVHRRFKRGYRNVINESIRLNAEGVRSDLAMETSGHGALKENYFLDDGAYLMVKLVIELAKAKRDGYTLESLIADLREPAEAKEFRFKIGPEDFKPYGQKVLDDLAAYAKTQADWRVEPENYEGIRVNIQDGWFLLRLSLHDPILPLNIEGDSEGSVMRIAKELAPFLKQYDLQSEAFEAFLGA